LGAITRGIELGRDVIKEAAVQKFVFTFRGKQYIVILQVFRLFLSKRQGVKDEKVN